MTTTRLHVPDEPSDRLVRWRGALREGVGVDQVLLGPDGVAAWYWHRWRSLERDGLDEAGFTAILRGHARELALWLRGERPHRAVAAQLAGRVERRLPCVDTPRAEVGGDPAHRSGRALAARAPSPRATSAVP